MGKDRETFKHAAIYSSAAILGKLIGFLMLPFYAHILRDIGYGVIGMIESTMTILVSLLAHGLRGAIIRIYHEEEGENKQKVISTGVLLLGAVTLVMVGLTMLASRPLSQLLLGDPAYYKLLCLALGGFFFDLTGQAAGATLLIERKSVYFSLIGLLRLVIGLSLNIYLIIVLRMGLMGYFLSSFFTCLVPALVFYTLAFRKSGFVFERRIARKLIAFQWPLIPSSIVSTLSRQAERILVRFMIDIPSVGVLSMGYKFPVLLNMFISEPFMKSWNTERIAIADQPEGPERIGRMFTYLLYLMVLAGLVLAVCIKNALELLTPPEFWPAFRIARVEIATVILVSSSFHLNFGLLYAKDTKTWAVVRSTMAVIKIGLSYLFISLWGLYGAAYSACVVAAITMLWGTRVGQARYRIRVEYRKIALLAVAALGIFWWLANVDLSGIGVIRSLSENGVPRLADWLSTTDVGTWKEGKVVSLLQEKADILLDMLAKILLCTSYLIFFPFVHDPTLQKLQKRFPWLRRR